MDMVDLASLNYWAIVVATVASFALGGLWYGPLFGKSWLLALGKTEEDIPPSATPFVVTLLHHTDHMRRHGVFCSDVGNYDVGRRFVPRSRGRRRVHCHVDVVGHAVLPMVTESVLHPGRVSRGIQRHHGLDSGSVAVKVLATQS